MFSPSANDEALGMGVELEDLAIDMPVCSSASDFLHARPLYRATRA